MQLCENIDYVNIRNSQEISILDFAKEIIELTGSKSKIIYEELPKDDPQVRQPDINRAKEGLNWEPKYDRKEGLVKTLYYFKKKVKIVEKNREYQLGSYKQYG